MALAEGVFAEAEARVLTSYDWHVTDTRLRELERRFKESGSSEDELAWLIERTRSGEKLNWESYSRLAELNVEAASEYLLARVERGDLELAAYCSHEPARVALGEGAPEVPEDLDDLALGLESWTRQARVCAAVTAARLALPVWNRLEPSRSTPLAAVRAAETWLLCPCDEHATAAYEAGDAVSDVLPQITNSLARSAARACCEAAWAASCQSDNESAKDCLWALREAVAAVGASEKRVRDGVSHSLIRRAISVSIRT